jgi:ElaB/YqjD/DUF883 family membrane-anchored ribosome-binding protein
MPRFGHTRNRRVQMDERGQQEGLASQASAKVEDAASLAQEKASELREQGSARVRDQFDQRSTRAGSQVRALAEALRRSGNELSNEDNSNATQLTTQAADRIERVGNYLEQKSGDEVMRDVERFVRRRPWMLAGVGMLVGAAAARFVKASSEQRNDENRESGWPKRSGATTPTGSRPYRQAELPNASSHLRDEPATVGADVSATQDDPVDRDPYAGPK